MMNLSSILLRLCLTKEAGALTALLLFSLLFSPLSSQASLPQGVAINEIAWMGAKIDGVEPKNWWRYEWFEIYNSTKADIPLDDWEIAVSGVKDVWTLRLRGEVSAEGYFLAVSSDKIFSSFNQNYSDLGGRFSNEGQKVSLTDASGILIDEIDCTYGWFAGDNAAKRTMERKDPLLPGNDPLSWGTSRETNGTPGGNNDFPEAKTNAIYPSGIFLNELLPSPQGKDEENEWIEISNNNSFDADISGWKITDGIGVSTDYTFPSETIIGTKGFIVLARPETKITLNNSGDKITLLRPDGTVADTVEYKDAPINNSFARTENDWDWSTIPTPGASNNFPIETSQEAYENSPSIQNATAMNIQASAVAYIPRSDSWIIFATASLCAVISGAAIMIFKKSAIK
ncbi:MAG: lamin tail domain-containing protein [Patescibacteria group bacterium]